MLNHFLHFDDSQQNIDDNVIIDGAAKVFAEKGYTSTDFSDIARELNISENLIKGRFLSKESLFTKILLSLADTDNFFKDCDDELEMLVVIIESMREEIKKASMRSKIFKMILFGSDIPNTCKAVLKENIMTSEIYKALGRAQLEGRVISGNTFEVLKKFVVSTFTLIEGYSLANIELPDNEFFINIIQKDDDNRPVSDKEYIRMQNSVIAAFTSDFLSILFVDLDTDKIDVFQVTGEHDDWIAVTTKKGFAEYKQRFAEKFIAFEDRERVLNEMTTENIMARLEEEPVFDVDYKIISHGEPVSFRSQVAIDPLYSYGNKILIGGRRLYN